MTKERLDELEQPGTIIDREDQPELIRLARLGLWAEEYGIPIVSAAAAYHDGGAEYGWHFMHSNSADAYKALKAVGTEEQWPLSGAQ